MNKENTDKEKPKRRRGRGKHELSRRRRRKVAAEKAAEAAAAWMNAEAEAIVADEGAVVQGAMPEIWKRTFRSLGQWHRQQVWFFLGVDFGEDEEEDEEKSSQEGEYEVIEVNPPETVKEDDIKEDDVKEDDIKEDDIKEDDDEVDPDYLKFLEVTRKHQQELKKIRAEEEQKIMYMRARDLSALTISARPGN